MTRKKPLIEVLAARFPEYTREQLGAFAACRNVVVGSEVCTDLRMRFPEDVPVSFTFERYVSRGGLKLERALDAFGLDVTGLVMLDAGSSTGGFTDCLLQHGASLVHAVDVGTNQLAWRLRRDPRVIVHEQQNIMTLEALDPTPQAAVCDLSFRSVAGAAGHIRSLCGGGWLVCLIKPQFEVPKGLDGFHGVIEDEALCKDTVRSVCALLRAEDTPVCDIVRSPITGHKGNTEYLALIGRGPALSDEGISAKL